MQFEETKEFEGDAAEVWKRASAVTEIPKYWHGTRTLEVTGESRGAVHVKIRFAFGGSGEADISTDEAKRVLTIDYTSGPFTGKQTVEVADRKVVAVWDVKFRGAFRLMSRWNENHFKSGTAHALERLTDSGNWAS
ncbi:MAG: SRPBCC family protein [Nitrososphaerota archaeon]|nr:SRPBCC family protein [Nitrososphaerota archaeon]MDG7030608.1 SRPBCC family protein [Nitrososphaerota archaeon]